MKIVINESDDLSFEELMILYVLHNRTEEEIDNLFQNVVDNYIDTDKANALGIIELRNIEVLDFAQDNIRQLTRDFREQFRGIKAGVISTADAVSLKLKQFKEKYKFSDEQIIKAAKDYVQSCAPDNYQYLQRADRFILTTEDNVEISKLAAFCEEVDNNEEEEDWNETI